MNAPNDPPFTLFQRRARTPRRRKAPPYPRKILFQLLEPRVLLSADLASPGVAEAPLLQKDRDQPEPTQLVDTATTPALVRFSLDAVASEDLADESWIVDVPAKTADAAPPIQSQVVFLDEGIEDADVLRGSLTEAGYRVVALDSDADGVHQITQALAGEQELSAIHIFSHGFAGGIDLGGAQLDADTLGGYAEQLATWRDALASDADILLYGCNVAAGERGVGFVQALAEITGADIAASDDLTGGAAQGGDWDLERVIGNVDGGNAAGSADFSGYAHTLLGTIDLSEDGAGDAAIFTITAVGNGSVTLTVENATDAELNRSHIGVTSVSGKLNMKNTLQATSDASLRYLIKNGGTVEVYDALDALVLTARNIENLAGGDGTDKFQLEKGAQLEGDLDGRGGLDTLEYQGELSVENRVDLRAGPGHVVGGVTGRVEGIEIVLGAQSKDVLVASDRGGDVFEGREGNDTLIGGAHQDTLFGGDGADVLEVGPGGDKLYGGRGNDTYRFAESWDAPETLEELVDGGRDELDFQRVAGNLTVTLSGSTGAGMEIKNSVPAVPTLSGVKYVEILRADLNAGQNHRYVFNDDWAEGLEKGFASIMHGRRQDVQGGTVELDFGSVDIDLLFELGAGGEVTVFDNSDPQGPVLRLYATLVTDLAAGKGNNTFVITSAGALSGIIKDNPAPNVGQRNVLDYSRYSGEPIVVDLLNGRATGIGGIGAADQQAQARNEMQQIVFTPGTGTPGGTFRLGFRGEATEEITLAMQNDGITVDAAATQGNIAAALQALNAIDAVNVVGQANVWTVSFTNPGNTNLPPLGVVESSVTGGQLSVTTTQQGAAETGPGVPAIREVKAGTVALTLIGADLLENPVAGSTADDVLVAGANLASSVELNGGVGDDQLMGGSAGDTLRGGDGVDTLYGLGDGDILEGGNRGDFLFGGDGVDILRGGPGDDRLEGGTGTDVLDGGQGDDTYVFRSGFGQDTLADPGGTDTLDFSGMGDAIAFSVSGGGLTAGTGVFTRDPDRTVDVVASLRPSSGSFAAEADTVTVAAFKEIENITVGSGANWFYFDKVDHSIRIDARNASRLDLDFQGTVQTLEFEFSTDADTGATKLTVKENSTIQKGLSFFHLKTRPVITVIGVDANTTIWGGRNDNVFQLKGNASFAGTVRGGTGKALTTIPFTDTVIIHPTKLSVSNALDYSGLNFTRPRIVNLSSIFSSALQGATGFGTVIDVSDVRYGASLLNIIAGTNASPSGLGSNTFSPGTMSLPLGPGIPAPGIHVFAGGTGADTYKFNNLWGFAAVIEPPDLVIDGTAAPEFFDTLDFSGAFGDFRIVIDQVTLGNLSFLEDLLPQNRDNDPDNDVTLEIGTNFITVVDRGGPLSLLRDALGAIGVSEDFLDSYVPEGESILYALDIENIVTSRFGNTEIVFKNGAVLKGIINASSPGGTVDLDYSEYFPDDHAGPGVTVEAGAGANAVVGGSLGSFELPTLNFTWGNATGVSGHRLSGATELLVLTLQGLGYDGPASAIADFLGDFAVSGIRNVTGTPYADTLTGNYKDNILTGLGGADTLDGVGASRFVIDPFGAGSGGIDTVSFASIETPVTADLGAGTGTIYAADGVTVVATLARLANLQNVIVGPGGGEFTGSSADNVFFLTDGFGDTTIHTGGGRDTIDVTGVTTPVTADAQTQGSLIVTTVDGAGITRTVTVDGDVEVDGTVTYSSPPTPLSGNTVLALPDGVTPGGGPVAELTAAELAPIVTEAVRRWRDAGVLPVSATDDELDDLASTIDIVDLPDGMLARESPLTGRIELDMTAAGFGWFVDPTPVTDSEYDSPPDPAADAHIDLLTVVMHEIGHVLALGHAGAAIAGTVMSGTLGPGERRRVPILDEIAGLTPSDESALALGLGAFGDWIRGLGPKLETLFSDTLALPFVDLSFADLFGIDPGTGQAIADAVASRVRDAVQAEFDSAMGPVDTDQLLAIPGLELVPSSNLKEYRATLDLWRFHDEVSPDFDSAVFAELGLSGSGGFSLDVDTSLDLDFVFGIDASNQFYVLDPGVTARLFLGHDANDDGVADPFDLGISLGIIGAEIQDGVLDLSAALRIGTDERLTYADLIADTVPASSLLPSFDADSYYLVDLPVAMTGLLSGVNGDGLRLRAESGEVPVYGSFADFFLGAGSFQGLELSTINLDDILGLRGISLDDLLAGLSQLADTLAAPDGPLYEPIPLVGISVADALGDGVANFAEGFGQAIDTVRESARNIGELEAQLNAELQDFFGLGDVDPISMGYADSTFDFDLDLEALIQRQYDLGLDLDALDLQQWLGVDPGEFLDVNLAAQIDLQADLDLHLGFGFDLGNVLAPELFVDTDTGFSVTLSGEARDIAATLGIVLPGIGGDLPPLGLVIKEGSARIGLGAFANFGAPEGDADGDGRVTPGSIGSAFQSALSGAVAADLPMYFPIKALPLGGTTEDRDGDGIPDHVFHLDAGLSLDENLALQADLEFALPRFSLDFDAAVALIALLNDPATLLTGLEGFFSGIDKVADGVDFIELPLVGGAPFDDLAGSLRGLRTDVLGHKLGADYLDGLGKWLQDKANDPNDEGVFEVILDRLRTDLFNGLSPISGELFAFVVPQLDEFGALQYDENGKLVTKLPASPDDMELTLSPQGELTFNLRFGGVLVGDRQPDGTIGPAELPIDFSAGLAGINLDVDAALQAQIDYLMGIGLGLSPSDGVFLDTSGINARGEEIALDVGAELVLNEPVIGTLGFLKMVFDDHDEEGNPLGRTGLFGHLGLDIADSGGDGRWTLFEGLDLALNASAFAEANLFAKVESSAGAFLPSVSTIIHFNQILGDIELSTDGGARFDIGSPEVVLENVKVNVGSVFRSFLGDTLNAIGNVILPLEPLVKLLTTEIDLGIAKVKILDMARLRLPAKTVDNTEKVLEVLDSTIEFLKDIQPMLEGDGIINFGTFHLTESAIEDPDVPTSDDDVAGAQRDDKDLTPEQKETLKGPDQKGLDERPASNTGGSGTQTPGEKQKRALPSKNRFSIPLLEDPASLIDFVLNRAPVDLFYYDLPDLDLLFEYRKTFPIYPGLNAGLSGAVGATTNFDFGFDTRGLSKWMREADFDPGQALLIFDGFYLDDHGQENTIGDEPEATITAAVGAVASLGISGLIEAGVVGGIETQIDFDLNDTLTEIAADGNTLIGDGKMYGRELLSRLSHGPLCLFDMHGMLSVFMDAFFWVGLDLGFSRITLFEASDRFADAIIAEFDFECVIDQPDDVADVVGGVADLRYVGGKTSGEGNNYLVAAEKAGDKLDTFQKVADKGYVELEAYQDEADRAALVAQLHSFADGEDLIVISTGGRAEFFRAADVDTIRADGTAAEDHFVLRDLNGLVSRIELHTGEGDDVIEVVADPTRPDTLDSLLIDGEGGHDHIRVDPRLLGAGAPGTYVVRGGAGNDRIKLAESADEDGATSDALYFYSGVLLDGGDGEDRIFGHSGGEEVDGGAGNDAILTYGGSDVIFGGAGDDFIASGTGDDHVWAEEGDDRVLGGSGADELHGGSGDDALMGEEGNDTLFGEDDDDLLIGGLGDDLLFGGTGDDAAEWQLGEGVDTFDGDEGRDQLSMIAYVLDEQAFYDDPANYVIDDGLVDTVVVSPHLLPDDSGLAMAEISWTHGQDAPFAILTGEVETLKLDAGRGADDFLVEDMQTTSVDSVRVSAGQNQGIVERVSISRDALGRALGQDLRIEGSAGQEFRLRVGAYGAASRTIVLADDGSGGVDRQSTAIDMQAALRELLGDATIEVAYDPDIDRYKVSGLVDAADEILLAGGDVEVFSSSLQRLQLTGNAEDQFSVRFGAGGESSGLVELAPDGLGGIDREVTAANLGVALRALTGNGAIEIVYQSDTDTYAVAGMEVGGPPLELDVALSDAGVTLSSEIVQELDLNGIAGQSFVLRFGSDGEATAPILVEDDAAATAAGIEAALQALAGFETLTVTHDAARGLFVVGGFEAGAASLETVPIEGVEPVTAAASSTQSLQLTGTAGSLFRLRFGDGGLETDFLRLEVAAGGGVDTAATAAGIQEKLRALFESPRAAVAYDADAGRYIVSGLDGATPLLQVDDGGLTTDVVGSATGTRDLALDGEAGQQFRLRLGATGALSGVITLADDGSGAIDAGATALALQDALRALTGDDTVSVEFDADLAIYRISGLDAPSNALELANEGLVSDVTADSRPGGVVFKVFDVGGDNENDPAQFDTVLIRGSEGADDYRVSTIEAVGVDGKGATSLRYEMLNGEVSPTGKLLSHVVVDVFGLEKGDAIRLDALGGNDRIDATAVATAVVANLVLDGGAGDDRLIGSNQRSISDVLIGGAGSDRITGGAGIDRFYEEILGIAGNRAGDVDTLVETRDADFTLSNTRLGIDDTVLHNQFGNEVEDFDDIFEAVELFGGDGANTFAVSGWSDSGVLDGAKGGDTYVLELARTGAGRQFFDIRDTGASGIDSLTYKGSSDDDTIQLDTVYDPAQDAEGLFTDARWLEYGAHGDGLIIGHFDADASGFEVADLEDEDRLMAVTESSLAAGSDFQVVNYATVEEVVVFGGEGDDTFISDDTGARFNVFGNAGDDRFHVGSVLETEDVIVEGQIVTIVRQITRGASFNDTSFYGGDGDDYFEVNHNAADINLYGDNGDDVFLVKALLTVDDNGDLQELASLTATVSGTFGEDSELGGSDTSHDTRDIDIDTLVYVENANVSIDGGAGFDAVSLVGTVLSDTFHVYAEIDPETGQRVQRIYGAGVKLQRLLNIEQIQLLTGAGDDTVFLYGSDLGVIGDLVIRTGSGSDTVLVGGPEQIITQIFPRSSSQFFSTVEGYEVPKDATGRFERAGEVDGLPFYRVRETSRVVPFEVENPGRSENRLMPASYDLAAFRSPVVIDAGTGLNDEILFNTQLGTARLRLADDELLKKDLVFDTAKIRLLSQAADPDADLPAVLLAAAGGAGEEARELLAAVATDYVRFVDRYTQPGLMEEIAALSGAQAREVVVPAGVSYFTIETTLVDNVVITAREQLIDFAAQFGLDLEWKDVAHPDPTRAAAGETLHELLAIRKGDAEIPFEALHTETVVFDGNGRGVVKDLSGLTLKTVAPLSATFEAGAITRSVEIALGGSVGNAFRITGAGGSTGELLLAEDGAGEVDRAATARAIQAALRALTGSDLPAVRAIEGGIYRITGLAPEYVDLQVDTTGLPSDVTGSVSEVDPVEPVRIDPVNVLHEPGENARLYLSGFEAMNLQLSEASATGSELHIDNDLFTGRLGVQGGAEADHVFIENVAAETTVHGGPGDDVITVGRAGLLDEVNAPLYLFGDEGKDEIVVEGSANPDGAEVDIDKNVLEHTESFEQLSRVTDALGLQGITDAENLLLEDRLKEAALPYGQAALEVHAADLTTYRDYAADALLAELGSIVGELETQIGTEIDEAIDLLVSTDQDLLENQIKLYLRTRYYETVDIQSEILDYMSDVDNVKTYLEYIDLDPKFYFDWVKGPFGIRIPIPKVRWVVDKVDSGRIPRDWDIKEGLAEIQAFFQNPDKHFKTYGLSGVANDNLSKGYLKDIQNILNNNSLHSLVSASFSAKNGLKLLGGGKLDDDETMRLYLNTAKVGSTAQRENALALAKIFDEVRARYNGSSSIYAGLLGQRDLTPEDLDALYAEFAPDDADRDDPTKLDPIRGFAFGDANTSKAEMVLSVGDFPIVIAEQYRRLSDSVQDKVAHLDGEYRAAYLDQVAALKEKIEGARNGHDYSATTLEEIRAGLAALKAFLHPLSPNAADAEAGGEGTLIKAQAYNFFAVTTGNGIADRIAQLAALSDRIEATDFGAVGAVADSADYDALVAVFNGDAYQDVRAAYGEASDVIASFTLFNARYLGGAEAPAGVAEAAGHIRQLDAVAERFAAFDDAVSGGFSFDDFREAFLATQQEITTFIETNPDYIDNLLVASRAGAQAASLAQDAVDITEPVAVNRIQYDLFNDALTQANKDLGSLKTQLRKEYTREWKFLWWTIKIELDYTHDARYTKQLKLISDLKSRVAASARFADPSDRSFGALDQDKRGYETVRDNAESRVADKRARYEELKTSINGQFAVLKELSRFAIEVLRDTRQGEPLSGFVDTGSLISELREFHDDYTVLDPDGMYEDVSTQQFLDPGPNESRNSILLSETHVSHADITKVGGMSAFGIHVGYDDVEQLTLVLGDQADTVHVHDTLGGAGSRVSVLTGGGDDHVEIGNGGSLDDIVGEVFVDAGAGDHNVLTIDDSADPDADSNVVVTDASVTGLAPGGIEYDATGGAYGSHYDAATGEFSAGIEIRAGTGGDSILAQSSRNTEGRIEVTRIDAGSGGDEVTIADTDARYLEVHGGSGMDRLEVTVGAAFGGVTVFGGEGNDLIIGGPANDVLVGGLGADDVRGGDGDDVVVGDNAHIVRGARYGVQRIATRDDEEGGGDTLSSSRGNDVILGGAGGDTLTALFGGSILLGDAGVVVFEDGSADEWDVFTTTPEAGGDDTLIGGPETNILIGGFGRDTIVGGDGDDVILGDGGRVDRSRVAGTIVTERASTLEDDQGDVDDITGGDGRDIIIGGAAGDVITASLGGDIILGDEGVAELLGDVFTTNPGVGGDDIITGGAGLGAENRSIIIGGAGGDTLTGGDGDNVLLGDGGRVTRVNGVVKHVISIDPETGGVDTIVSGNGNDIIVGGAAGDRITVGLGSDIVLGDNGEVNLNNSGPGDTNDIRSVRGDIGGDDTLTGGEGESFLIGGFGADTIVTGTGSTVIIGDNGEILRDESEAVVLARTDDADAVNGGIDKISTQGGRNIILGGLGGDEIDASEGSNIVLGDNGVVNVGGDVFTTQEDLGGNDTIAGGADNIILGGFGGDRITLGAGTNTVLGDNGVVSRAAGVITRVATTDEDTGTGGVDQIASEGGTNIILGGVGGDDIDASKGSNIVLGDNGVVNVGGDVSSNVDDVGGDDTIQGGADNIILGGFGGDTITLGGGTNIVLGDNGVVRRPAGVVTQVKTTDAAAATGGDDRITSEGGDNILIGGVGDDTIVAAAGTNIVLGDNGEVNVGGNVFTTEEDLGGNDVIVGGSVSAVSLLLAQSASIPVSNIILGGAGGDVITLGSGTNTVLGDNGVVRRDALGAVLEVETGGTAGDADTITSLGGENIILGGMGDDRIDAPFGTNIILGDNGRVTVDGDVETTQPELGGADAITGGEGDNIILGGAGGDRITGGAGNDIVLGDNGAVRRSGGAVDRVETTDGLVGGDDEIDGGGGDNVLIGGAGRDLIRGGSGNDVVVGDNGSVELTPAGPVVTSFDEESGGADELHGGDGNDVIYGGGGDDVLLGELGDDALHGQRGDDILLGDTGRVEGRRVLLTDVATRAGDWALSGPDSPDADPAVFHTLIETDLVLLAGRMREDGTQDMRLLLLSLAEDGDDVLTGGAGNDALFGQRGDDDLSGDDGDDLLSGGAGDDALRGGDGDDTLIGDDTYNDSAGADFPDVAHGLLLDGRTLVPMVSVEPGRDTNALATVLPQVFGGEDAGELIPYASVITGFADHLDQLRGNDALWGEAGDDTLIGDDQMVTARADTFDADRMARAEAATRTLLDVSDDLSDLVHRQYGLLDDGRHSHDHGDVTTVVDNVFTVGADLLDGGEGNDVLIGDDNLVLEASFTLPAGLAGDFERFAEGMDLVAHELTHVVQDLGDLDRHLREETALVAHKNHFHEALLRRVDVVEMGNDTLLGGAGNDLIIGDAFLVRTAGVTLVPGGSTWHAGHDDDWQDRDWKDGDDRGWLHHHDHDDWAPKGIRVGADTILGGAGDDLVFGDSLALSSHAVTRGVGLSGREYDKAREVTHDALHVIVELTDAAAYWLAPQGGRHHHGHDGHWHVDEDARFDNGDHISGGDGDDVLFGQGGDDYLNGDSGNDWLIGGEGKDKTDGGAGRDTLKRGEDNSSHLRREVGARLIDWSGAFGNYGLPLSPFGGLELGKGGYPNLPSFAILEYDRPGPRWDDD